MNIPEIIAKMTLEAVKRGELSEADIDASAERILTLAFRAAEQKRAAASTGTLTTIWPAGWRRLGRCC